MREPGRVQSQRVIDGREKESCGTTQLLRDRSVEFVSSNIESFVGIRVDGRNGRTRVEEGDVEVCRPTYGSKKCVTGKETRIGDEERIIEVGLELVVQTDSQ